MTQSDLNRAVARATGETVRTIAELGFSLVDPVAVDDDLPRDPQATGRPRRGTIGRKRAGPAGSQAAGLARGAA